jgi:hypothetical protein
MPSEIAKQFKALLKQHPEFLEPKRSIEERRERKSYGAKLGHIKRKLREQKPLNGQALELALNAAVANPEIVLKLKSGKPLNDYELHLMTEMYLL